MHLTLHLTQDCNMRCTYCYAPPKPETGMTPEIGRKAMDLGSRLNSGSCGIAFFGGEPLLRKDLIAELVDYGRHLERNRAGRFHFKMTTNGLLLDDAFLEFAVKNDILIALSLDGIQKAHDNHRLSFPDRQPTHKRLLPVLDRLLSVKPYSSVMMLINPDTAEYLCDSVEFLLERGCRYIIVSLNYAAPWTENDFSVLNRNLVRLGKRYVQWTNEGRKFYLSPFEVKIASHVNKHCHRKERCELGARQVSVASDGHLYPCVQFTRAGRESAWCIGSVFDGIDEVKRESLRLQAESEKTPCVDCAVKERCNNTCGCLNWQTTGSIDTVSPVLCRYERMLFPIADRIAGKLYTTKNPDFLHKHYNAAYPVLSLIEDALPGKAGVS